MTALQKVAAGLGWSSVLIGGIQLVAGAAAEAGMQDVDATIDSHVRFMGAMFVGYGVSVIAAGRRDDADMVRLLAGLMGVGGASRLLTRVTRGRPHRFHDALMLVEFATPLVTELAQRKDR